MTTDWYPTQEGRLVDGLTISAIAGGAIVEGSAVKFGTSASGQITVQAASAIGDGFAVSIKAASTGDPVGVLVFGLYKMTIGGTDLTQGSFVINSGTIYAVYAAITSANYFSLVKFGGASHMLGQAMQSATADGDEAIVFVGKTA
jgi:hypothetical protein